MDDIEVVGAPRSGEGAHLYLVFSAGGRGGLFWTGTDRDDADTTARNVGGILCALPTLGDYRLEVKER